MFDIQNYAGFLCAVFLFQLYPGAGTVAILNATARGGVRGGIKAVYGTLTGDFIYMLSAVLGLAAILAAYPGILAAAQRIGAVYLIWIGIKFMRGPAGEQKSGEVEKDLPNFFRQALAVSLTNPKAIMFFMAFFPLFIGPGSKPQTLALLMAHVTLISFLYQCGLVWMGNTAMKRLSKVRCIRSAAARLAGVAIMAFGVKLLIHRK